MPRSILDKRNKDKIDIFLKKLEEGIPIKYATAIAGFDESTYFRAMQVAEKELTYRVLQVCEKCTSKIHC